MGKKVRISDESVNCYGTRIITSGIDLTQYERNPVLLYMHDRSQGVVGLVKNLKVENGELTGEIEFDGATELSQRLKKQYEFGSMRMVSANLQILETSDDKSLVLEGQTATAKQNQAPQNVLVSNKVRVRPHWKMKCTCSSAG